jgi:hypothetical protein
LVLEIHRALERPATVQLDRGDRSPWSTQVTLERQIQFEITAKQRLRTIVHVADAQELPFVWQQLPSKVSQNHGQHAQVSGEFEVQSSLSDGSSDTGGVEVRGLVVLF